MTKNSIILFAFVGITAISGRARAQSGPPDGGMPPDSGTVTPTPPPPIADYYNAAVNQAMQAVIDQAAVPPAQNDALNQNFPPCATDADCANSRAGHCCIDCPGLGRKHCWSCPAAPKKCCVCQYLDVAACHGPGTNAACTAASTDCTWSNGACIPRFQQYCNDWIAAQTGCDQSAIVADNQGPSGGLQACTQFNWTWKGHGQGCVDYANRIRVCINGQADMCNFNFTNIGCQNFNNIPDATAAMNGIVASLGGQQCVSVTGNQCNSFGDNQCSTDYTFNITPNASCGHSTFTCQFGQGCSVPWQTATCNTSSGQGISVQKCCCTGAGADGIIGTADDTNCTWKNVLCQ